MFKSMVTVRLLGAGVALIAAGISSGPVAAAPAAGQPTLTATVSGGQPQATPFLKGCETQASAAGVGALLTVKGAGFAAGDVITLTWDTTHPFTPPVKITLKATATGFSKVVPVPVMTAGGHTITAKGSKHDSSTVGIVVGGSTCFTVTGNATTHQTAFNWFVGGADATSPASLDVNGAQVSNGVTNASGYLNQQFSTPCAPGTATFVVHLVVNGQQSTGQNTFTMPTC